jgi:hypothetical protein
MSLPIPAHKHRQMHMVPLQEGKMSKEGKQFAGMIAEKKEVLAQACRHSIFPRPRAIAISYIQAPGSALNNNIKIKLTKGP